MFQLTFDTDNAAFQLEGGEGEPSTEAPYYEIERIFGKILYDIFSNEATAGKVFDYNGNSIGSWELI